MKLQFAAGQDISAFVDLFSGPYRADVATLSMYKLPSASFCIGAAKAKMQKTMGTITETRNHTILEIFIAYLTINLLIADSRK
jgi:hypothetical protein